MSNNDKLEQIAEGLNAIYSIRQRYSNIDTDVRDGAQPKRLSLVSDVLKVFSSFSKAGGAGADAALEKATRLSNSYRDLKRYYLANAASYSPVAQIPSSTQNPTESDAIPGTRSSELALIPDGQLADNGTLTAQTRPAPRIGVRKTLEYLQPALSSRSSLVIEKAKNIFDILKA
ncbi:MAG: hypothetical protein PHV32_03585 [Eubacteriales bacterium]|nr:hypothetical protein [Eubacteriales bacterium]